MTASRNDPKPLDPLYSAVGLRVTAMREQRGWKPAQLAELASMDVNYLWRIEAGRQNLSLRNVARLAKALDVTLAELLEGVDVTDLELGTRSYSRRVDEA